ncbi:MAG: hypothetical protein QW314_04500 [Thermoproteota archaeon]
MTKKYEFIFKSSLSTIIAYVYLYKYISKFVTGYNSSEEYSSGL